jgi:GTPase-associated protein 1, N-terminal domain type 2
VDLHLSRSGLSDHSGFQFVAVTAGTTAEHMHLARQRLEYRPPRSAPARPIPAEIARFPVAFGYSPTPEGAIISLCRYLGSDFTDRPGNFLGIAVIADQAELAGALPVEMWRAPW